MKKLSDLLNSDSESDFDDKPTKMAMTASLESASDAISKSVGKRKRRIIDSDSDSDDDLQLKVTTSANLCATSIETNLVPEVCETVSTPLLSPLQSSVMTCEPVSSSLCANAITPSKHVETAVLAQQLPLVKQLRERSTMCLGDLLDRSSYRKSPLKTGTQYFKEDTIVFLADMHTENALPSSSSHATSTTHTSPSSNSEIIPGAQNKTVENDHIDVSDLIAKPIPILTRIEPRFDDWMEEITIPPTGKSTEVITSTLKKKRVRNTAKKKVEKNEVTFEEEESAAPLETPASPKRTPPLIFAFPPAPVAAVMTMLVPPLPHIEIRMPDDLTFNPYPGTDGLASKRRTLPKSLGKVNSCDFYVSKFIVPSLSAEKQGMDNANKLGVLGQSYEEVALKKSDASGFSFQDSQGSCESDDSVDVIRAALSLNSPGLGAVSSKVKANKLRRLSSNCQQGRFRGCRFRLLFLTFLIPIHTSCRASLGACYCTIEQERDDASSSVRAQLYSLVPSWTMDHGPHCLPSFDFFPIPLSYLISL